MRLSQLRTFVAIARAGGVSAAARQLHVSQPTLTTQVRLLEEKYGVELFHRVGRGVALTETGRRLFALTGQLAGIEDDAVQLLKEAGELRSGLLLVGAVSPYQVTDILAEFSRRYPSMQVQVRFGNSEFVLRQLLDFGTDVGVLAQFAADPRLHSLPYGRDSIVALVARDHPFAGRRSIRIEQLAGQRMVVREQGSTARKVMDAALAKAGVAPVVVMELGSREAIREAVAKGIGIGTVAEVAYTPDSRLRMVRFSNVDVHTDTHVLCVDVRRSARVVSAFLDIARELSTAKSPPAGLGRRRR
jgi:LysR family transcriptional regulator, low CO2-responsive transcriptional regulator